MQQESLTENRNMGSFKKKDINWLALGLTVLVHVLLVLFLWLAVFRVPKPEDESGVPVMIGSLGSLDTDFNLTPVDTYQAPTAASTPEPVPTPKAADPIVTQDIEETVAIETGQKKKETAKPQEKKPTETQKKPTEAELKAQAEAKALAEAKAKAEADQRLAEQAALTAQQQMSNLFANAGAQTGAQGPSEAAGTPGSPTGNSTEGKTAGTGGWGSFDLGGRSLGSGGLKRPEYTVQEEGRVVVNITVDPSGRVIATSINKRTNTANVQLRNSAEQAARQTRFNAISSNGDNQMGTITYYFKLN